jgi:hypothetical protein
MLNQAYAGYALTLILVIIQALNLKADKDEVLAMELRLGSRTNTLEAAILKGLKVISDKVNGAAVVEVAR